MLRGRFLRRVGRRFVCVLALATVCMAPRAVCQFKHAYGGAAPFDEFATALVQAADGGYLVAGYQSVGPSIPYAYLVRTDPSGNRLWDHRYYIGSSASMMPNDAIQCANEEFVVVGSSHIGNIMLMRIDAAGDILWQRDLGTPGLGYTASAVIETASGDLVVCGYDYDPILNRNAGILMRLDPDGRLIWVQRYDLGPNTTESLLLFDVIEARSVGAGDLVATGSLWANAAAFDMIVLRVDGATGNIGAPPQGFAAFDGYKANDYGFSLIELSGGASPGDVVVAGSADRTAPNGRELLVVQTPPDPCDAAGIRSALLVAAGSWATGYALTEIADPALGTPGDVAVYGHAGGGAFLQQFTVGALAPVGAFNVYNAMLLAGRNRFVEANAASGASGFVMAGTGSGLVVGAPSFDMCLLKTDAAGSVCNHTTIGTSNVAPALRRMCLGLSVTSPSVTVPCAVRSIVTDWANDLCTDQQPLFRRGHPEPTATFSLASHPNPVIGGGAFSLQLTMSAPGSVSFTVHDVAGRTLYRGDRMAPAGPSQIEVPTDGWAAGTYVATVRSGAESRSVRVAVQPR